MFAQPFDHSFNDLFNQYVNMDTSSADGNKDVSFPSDFEQMFSLDSLSSDCGDHSPTVSTVQHTHQSAQHWGKDSWCLSQNHDTSADNSSYAFQDIIPPAAVSDLNAELEAPSTAHHIPETHTSPSTPPTTPSRKTKGGLFTPKSIRRHRDSPNDRRSVLRKQSFSPSLTRSSQLQKSRMAYPEAWSQRFQNFNFRNSDDCLPLSPPPSDILVQQENLAAKTASARMNHSDSLTRDSAEMPHQYDSSIFNHSPAIAMPSPSASALTRQPQRYLSHSNNSGLATSSPPSADDIFSSPHSSDPQSLSSWNSDSFGTPTLQFTPDLHNNDPQAWWSPMPSRVAQRQPSYQQVMTSPAPQRPIQAPTSQNDMLQGGLMIQLDPSQFDLSSTTQSSFPSSTMPTAAPVHEARSYHATSTPQKYIDASSFVSPQMQCQSRSPSLSPRAGGSPKDVSATRNSMMKTPQRRAQGRKMSGHSMGAPKPVKAGSPRGGNKSVTVSFVNFTPNDSQKILTGVAPSGSSKTKARREQEARDRRRKISEAALNAVRKAGGDVEALEAVLC